MQLTDSTEVTVEKEVAFVIWFRIPFDLRMLQLPNIGDNEDFELLLVRVKLKIFQSLIATLYFRHGRSLNSGSIPRILSFIKR